MCPVSGIQDPILHKGITVEQCNRKQFFMEDLMYNIKIEKLSTENDRIDTFETVEINGTVKIDHKFEFISNDKKDYERKRLSLTEFHPIAEAFENLDYTKIIKESNKLTGCEGWYVICTISKYPLSFSIGLYSHPDASKAPETTKFYEACNMIFELFKDPIPKKVFNAEYLDQLLTKHDNVQDMLDQIFEDDVLFENEEELKKVN